MSDSTNAAFRAEMAPMLDVGAGFQVAEDTIDVGEATSEAAPRRIPRPDDVPREPLKARDRNRGAHWKRSDMQED